MVEFEDNFEHLFMEFRRNKHQISVSTHAFLNTFIGLQAVLTCLLNNKMVLKSLETTGDYDLEFSFAQ